MADRPTITFSAYLTGGVAAGAPLWRDPSPTEPTGGKPAPDRAASIVERNPAAGGSSPASSDPA